jgi:hypothetical protein
MKFHLSLVIAVLGLLPVSNTVLAQTGTVQFSSSSFSVDTTNGSQTSATITVDCSNCPSNGILSVNYSTSNGTATAGVEYEEANGTLSFTNAAPASLDFDIQVLSTNLPGTNQTVFLTLSDVSGGELGTPSNATLAIYEQVQSVQFAETNFTTSSLTNGTTNAVITVVRSGPSGTGTVDYSAIDLTASNGLDYTSTTGTLVFVPGTNSAEFSVTVLQQRTNAPPDLDVSLMLYNPTGNAQLGSASNAELTILGPPSFLLSSAYYNVLEHLGNVNVTVLRSGSTANSAQVGYYTTAGGISNPCVIPAREGIDFYATTGTLYFASGVSSQSFDFATAVNTGKTAQINKSVSVVLTNSSSGTALSNNMATVLIINDKKQTVPFTDSASNPATIILEMAGYCAFTNQSGEPLALVISGADASSLLTIETKKSKGSSPPQIASITGTEGDEGCRVFDAEDFDLAPNGIIQFGGYVGELQLGDVLSNATVTAGGAETQNSQIALGMIADGASITVSSRISTLSAVGVGNATIQAPSIATMSVKGSKRNSNSGDCAAVITLSGAGLQSNQYALGKLSVSGAITNSQIIIYNGSVGSVTAYQMLDSWLSVGNTASNTSSLTDPANSFIDTSLRLNSVSITAPSTGFAGSFIVAPILGNIRFRSVLTDNGGTQFGVRVGQSMTSLAVPGLMPDKWDGFGNQSWEDFNVVFQP